MATQVDIFNIALGFHGKDSVTDPNEKTERAAAMRERWGAALDATLRAHPWNSALVQAVVGADNEPPPFGWTMRYTLPPDPYCLRVLTVNDPKTKFAIYGRKLLTDVSAPINLTYIGRIANPEDMDALLAETVAYKLAELTAFRLTNSRAAAKQARETWRDALKDGRSIDGQEGTPPEVISDDFLAARL